MKRFLLLLYVFKILIFKLIGGANHVFKDSVKLNSSKFILLGEFSHFNIKNRIFENEIIRQVFNTERNSTILLENKSFLYSLLFNNLSENYCDIVKYDLYTQSKENLIAKYDSFSSFKSYSAIGIDIPKIAIYNDRLLEKLDSISSVFNFNKNTEFKKLKEIIKNAKIIKNRGLSFYSKKSFLKIHKQLEEIIRFRRSNDILNLIFVNLSIDSKINSLRDKYGYLHFSKLTFKYFVNYRDSLMYMNLKWIENNSNFKKFIVLASNYHIKSINRCTLQSPALNKNTLGSKIENAYRIATYCIEDSVLRDSLPKIIKSGANYEVLIENEMTYSWNEITKYNTDFINYVLRNNILGNKRKYIQSGIVDEIVIFSF